MKATDHKRRMKFVVSYLDALVNSIIKKNFGVLRTIFSAYSKQFEKSSKKWWLYKYTAWITTFLESYFDNIFAINKIKL